MKAILKREQQIIDVISVDKENNTAKIRWIKPDGQVIRWDDVPFSELEFLNGEIDWDQRRYEIAKDILAAFMSNSCSNVYIGTCEDQAKKALDYADALIDELKKVI